MNAFIYGQYSRAMTWIGDVMVATKPPRTTAKQILEMREFLDAGNIICRYYTYYLDSIIIPGEFTHSGVIVTHNKIIHSIAEGVLPMHPIDFVKDTDGFIILKPKYPDEASLQKTLARARWHLKNKSQYDFTFKDPDKFYCHEFTVDCLNSGGITDIPLTKKSFGIFPFKFTREVYLADNIIKACKTVYVFRGGKETVDLVPEVKK
jgi:hypothetical protein